MLLKFSIKKKNFHCCYKKIFGWSKLVRSVFKKLVIEYQQGMRKAKRKEIETISFWLKFFVLSSKIFIEIPWRV